jgi:glycosyltransferase involved in cell wall biosynthesis
LTPTDSLSIVIPAYNEAARLPPTLKAVRDYLDHSPYKDVEILVVDDGSRDKTADVVEAAAREDSRVRLLRNPGNRGKGFSIKNGMLQARGDRVLFSDADLSAPIEELGKLMDAMSRENAMVAIGSRALDRSLVGVHQSAFRELAGNIFNLSMKIITGLPFADTQCGFKLYSREAAQVVFKRQQLERFGFDAEDLFIARLHALKTIEVPVRWNNVEGTKVSLLGGMQPFLDLLLIRWYQLSGRYRR